MTPLPTDNYDQLGKKPLKVVMDFFAAQEGDAKIDVFQALWDVSTDEEKELVTRDLRFFFLEKVEERRRNLNPAVDEVRGDTKFLRFAGIEWLNSHLQYV